MGPAQDTEGSETLARAAQLVKGIEEWIAELSALREQVEAQTLK